MKKLLSEARVFALRGFTIKTHGAKFFASPTGRSVWSRPYRTLHHVTTAVARRMAREFTKRDIRQRQTKGSWS